MEADQTWTSARGCPKGIFPRARRDKVFPDSRWRLLTSRSSRHRTPTLKSSKEPSGSYPEAEDRKALFDAIVPIYDRINDVMSLGQHREWKRRCVRYSGVRSGSYVLDICCGSGDVSLLLAEKCGPTGHVVGLDFSSEMLKSAREREAKLNMKEASSIEWIEADACDLPFSEGSFDAVTVSYGLRNVTDIPLAMSEMHRVLRSGGKLSVLDFNNSSNFLVDAFQALTLNGIVVPVTQLFGMDEEYRYIRSSIQHFPKGHELERLALDVGFRQARHYLVAQGLMGLLVAQKNHS